MMLATSHNAITLNKRVNTGGFTERRMTWRAFHGPRQLGTTLAPSAAAAAAAAASAAVVTVPTHHRRLPEASNTTEAGCVSAVSVVRSTLELRGAGNGSQYSSFRFTWSPLAEVDITASSERPSTAATTMPPAPAATASTAGAFVADRIASPLVIRSAAL